CGIAIFTGRLRYEADITLRRFGNGIAFDPILCADDVAASKPAPDGLLAIQKMKPGRKLTYVGDTVDDARSAAAAGVPFIRIVSEHHLRRSEIINLFKSERAIAIVENVNEIESVI